MKEHKKYTSITRYGKAGTSEVLREGDIISVTEKMDGANASFIKDDTENIGVSCFSRNNKLYPEKNQNLGGFYQWVQANISTLKDLLIPNYRYFGEWMCLSGDTEIKLVSGGKRGHTMTMREMYEYATNPTLEKSNFKKADGTHSYGEREPWWERYGYPKLHSLFIDEDIIKPQQMAKIIYTGDKEVYEVVTRDGRTIKSTLDHKFMTNQGWKQLKDIKIGDVVAVSDLINNREPRRYGKGSRKIKALFNTLKATKACEICGSNQSLDIHHKDQDWKNNELDNLQVLCRDCHKTQHKHFGDRGKTFNYNYTFEKIISIEYVGIEDCYDISMGVGENSSSFMANSFIVHNCPHKVKYKPEYTNQFFLFSIWDEEKQEYLSDEVVRIEAKRLGLRTVEYFYEGGFISFEHLMSFVGKSNKTLELNTGEGVVVKNVSYRDRNNAQVFVKLVSEKFAELQPQRLPKNPNIGAEHDATILSVLTRPRVEKMIFKLVDDGILEESYGVENMGIILKHIHRNILEDMLTEEREILEYIDGNTLAKRVGKLTPPIIKDILKEQGRL